MCKRLQISSSRAVLAFSETQNPTKPMLAMTIQRCAPRSHHHHQGRGHPRGGRTPHCRPTPSSRNTSRACWPVKRPRRPTSATASPFPTAARRTPAGSSRPAWPCCRFPTVCPGGTGKLRISFSASPRSRTNTSACSASSPASSANPAAGRPPRQHHRPAGHPRRRFHRARRPPKDPRRNPISPVASWKSSSAIRGDSTCVLPGNSPAPCRPIREKSRSSSSAAKSKPTARRASSRSASRPATASASASRARMKRTRSPRSPRC